MSIADALADPGVEPGAEDIDFDPPKLDLTLRPADFDEQRVGLAMCSRMKFTTPV